MADEKAKRKLSSVEDRVKDIEDKLAKHKEQEQKLNAMKQGIINREKEKERKARTHRLIQNGALAEQYLRCDAIPPEKFERLMKMLSENRGFDELLNQSLSRLISENKAVNVSSSDSSPAPVNTSPPGVSSVKVYPVPGVPVSVNTTPSQYQSSFNTPPIYRPPGSVDTSRK